MSKRTLPVEHILAVSEEGKPGACEVFHRLYSSGALGYTVNSSTTTQHTT